MSKWEIVYHVIALVAAFYFIAVWFQALCEGNIF